MSVDHFSARIEPSLGNTKIPVDRQSDALGQRVARHSIPYPGLRSFEIHEASLYFGREGATSELLQKLDSNRFITVVGPSGSGKSSLVKAGLVPALGANSVPSNGLPWAVAVVRPGPAPIRALAAALWELMKGDGDGGEWAKGGIDFLETMLRGTGSDLVSISQASRGMKGKRLLIIVDQFEDLFRFGKMTTAAGSSPPFGSQPIEQPPTNSPSGMLSSPEQSAADEPRLFVKLLLDVTSQAEVPVHVLVTLRTEYLGLCLGFQGLHEALSEGQYRIPPMTREQITQAIFCPAAASDVFFATPLMDRLLEDMEDRSDRLCLLQEALIRTWSHWKADPGSGRSLDLHHYEAAGGMAGALSQHADEVYLGLPKDAARRIAERLFKRLTGAGISGHDGRCPTRLGELCAIAAVETREMADVVTAFRTESTPLLVSIPNGPLTADSYVDITHESLVFAWRRLRQWVEEETGSAALYRRLAETAVLHEKGEAGLWGNPDLKLAEAWYRDQAPSPVWAQRYHPDFHAAVAFLEMSKAVAQRRKRMVASVLVLVAVVALLLLPWAGRSPLSLLGGIGGIAGVDESVRPESVVPEAGKSPADQGVVTPGTGAEISRRPPPESSPGPARATTEAAEIAAFETTIAGDDKALAVTPSPPAEIPSIVMKIAIPPRAPPAEQLATQAIGAPAVSPASEAPAAELAEREVSAPRPLPAAKSSTDSLDPGTEDLAKVLEAALDTDQRALTRRRSPPPEDTAGSELSAEVQAIAEALLAKQEASPVSATIGAPEDFVICRQVRHLEPLDIASRFPPGKVYAFAWVRTPKSQERITVKWLGDGGAVLGTSRLMVRRNLQRGYRTYTARTFSEAGRYKVGLYDESERLIGLREFTIE